MSTHLCVSELVELLPGAVELRPSRSMTPELTHLWTPGDPDDVARGAAVVVTEDDVRSMVPWAVAHGAAAVIVCAAPAELEREALDESIPVIAWPPVVGRRDPRDLKLAVQRAIIEAQGKQIERIHTIHNRLTQVALAGSGLDELARALGEIVANPVIIKSREHRNLSFFGDGGTLDAVRRRAFAHGGTTPDVVRELERRGIFARLRRDRRPLHLQAIEELEMAARVMAPIMMGEAYYGYISIAEVRHALAPVDLMATEQAATVAALILGREQAVRARERSLRSSYVYELLFGHESLELMERRAEFLGYPPGQRYAVMVLRPADAGPDSVRPLMEHIAAAADEHIRRLQARRGGLYAIALEGVAVAIYPAQGEASREEWLRRARQLLDVVSPVSDDCGLTIGVGCWQPEARAARHSFTQARLAAMVGQRLRGPNSVMHYQDLGLYRLLVEAVDPKELEAFRTEQVGALAEDEELLRTLRAYLDARSNKALAAKRLAVHLNTLKYRLQRISDLTGRDLNDPQTLLDLHVAIEIGDLASPSAAR